MGENSFTLYLITEIISRVPAKHLLRFTCVSKSWRTLIRTDPYFARLQRTALPYRPCLFVEEIIPPIPELRYSFNILPLTYNYWIDLESVEDQNINLIEIHNPFPCGDAQVVASCHNFVVVLQQHDHHNNIAVYNTTTRTHVMIPPNPAGDGNVVFFGFGYDPVHDCYKLLTRVKQRDRRPDLMVYNLDKSTWKRLDFGMWWKSLFELDNYIYIDSWYLNCNWNLCEAKCVDGAVYWFFETEIRENNTRMMVCFLLAEEEFHVVEPPEVAEGIKYFTHVITVFDGKLGFMCRRGEHEFWSLAMEYGDDGKRQWRWTKLLTIWGGEDYFSPTVFLNPVCFSTCKNKILILSSNRNQLFWYNIVKKEFNKVNDPNNDFRREGQLFWFDTMKKGVNRLNIPIKDCFDATSFAEIMII